VTRGDELLAQGKVTEAVAAYRQALHQDTLNPVILARLSRAYQASGNNEASERYLRRAMNLTFEEGRQALARRDTVAATQAFERTLEIFPTHPLALNQLGDFAQARGQREEAASWYERSAKANPEFAETFIKLGSVCLALGRTERARQAFARAVEININATQAYLGLGQILLGEQRWAAAAEEYSKALMVQPHSAEAQSGLAQARRHL
jgi:tetratricopeptide (TPR) repeat protein